MEQVHKTMREDDATRCSMKLVKKEVDKMHLYLHSIPLVTRDKESSILGLKEFSSLLENKESLKDTGLLAKNMEGNNKKNPKITSTIPRI